MRVFLCLMLCFVFATPALAQDDPDRVDAGEGLSYVKPDGWVVSPPRKGAVSALHKAGDEKSQIELRFAKIEADRAPSYFATFHASLAKANLTRVTAAQQREYGVLKGAVTEYGAGSGARGKSIFVFEFTTATGAWLVVGMFNAAARDAYLADLETLLRGVVVAP